jgi:hypothetical protein
MFLAVTCQHASGACQSHSHPVLSLREALWKYVELSPSTPPFLTLRFHGKDLTPTPNLLRIRLILPPLGHILSLMLSLKPLKDANRGGVSGALTPMNQPSKMIMMMTLKMQVTLKGNWLSSRQESARPLWTCSRESFSSARERQKPSTTTK